jgi:hypothetical protein
MPLAWLYWSLSLWAGKLNLDAISHLVLGNGGQMFGYFLLNLGNVFAHPDALHIMVENGGQMFGYF